MADVFEQFGGKKKEERQQDVSSPSPFEQFGGTAVAPTKAAVAEGSSPFAEFGGIEGEAAPRQPEEEGVGDWGDFLEGVKRGVIQEVAPFTESKEDLKKEREEPLSLARLGGEAIGGIGTGLAATAASAKAGAMAGGAIGSLFGGVGAVPGAAIGSLIGAGAGAIGYALYSGFGQEYIQSELAGQEFSPGRAVARSALQINPILRVEGEAASALAKVAPKLAKVAAATQKGGMLYGRAAAQIAGETAVAGSTYGEDSAIVTGLVSTFLSPFMFRGKKAPVTPNNADALDAYLATPVGLALSQKTAIRAAKEVPKDVDLSKALADSGFIDYALTRPGKLSMESDDILNMSRKAKAARFQRMMAEGGDIGSGGITRERIANMYKGYLTRNIAVEEAGKARSAIEREFTKQLGLGKDAAMPDAFGDVMSWLGDAQLIARQTDRKLGTNSLSLVNKLAETKGEYEVEAGKLFNMAIKAVKLQKKLGVDNEDIGRLRVFISEKDPSILSPKLQPLVDVNNFKIVDPKINKVMDIWDDAFEAARDTIRSRQYELGNIEHYIPMKMIPKDKMPIQIRRSLRTLSGWANSANKNDPLSLTSDDLAKLGLDKDKINRVLEEVSTLKRIGSSMYKIPKEDVSGAKLSRVIQDLLNESQQKGLGYEMSAMYSREGEKIAERFRDIDIGSSFARYVQSQVRGAIFDDIHRKLLDNVEVMKASGANKVADWWMDHLKDMTTGQQTGKNGVANALHDAANRYRYWIDSAFDDMKIGEDTISRNTLKGIPDLAAVWQSSLYPAYLALNVRAHLRNLTQVGAVTAPELGGAYGYNIAAKAYTRLAHSLIKGKSLSQELDDLGLGGSKFLAEKVQKDLKGIPGTGIAKKINDSLMALYSSTDVLNRVTTYRMGQIMAEDLLKGDKGALRALKRMGKATRAQLQGEGIREAIQSRDVNALGDMLGKMLVAKTQFHYGPEQRARVFRYMGPMFSMFSKWPSSVGSNIVDIWKENPEAWRKLLRYSEVYFAPLGALAAIGYGIKQANGDKGALAYLIGDPKEVSPLMSLDLSIGNNPTIEALGAGKDLVRQAVESKKPGKAAKGLVKKAAKKALTTAIPPVSSVINELERIEKKGMGKKKTTVDKSLETIFGK